MKLLLTGFDPFEGNSVNPALEAVKAVPDRIDDVQIVKVEVPTVFIKSIDCVVQAMAREKPDVVVCVGQAGRRFEVTPERVAINVDDARIADNDGNQRFGVIYPDGPAAYFATLPIKAMVQRIRNANIPSTVSNTAGTFVCNHLFYGVMYHVDKDPRFKNIKAGFIHVPFIPAQVVNRTEPAASMALQDITAALVEAIKAIGEHPHDIQSAEGKED
ncbi:MAG: pyroglutamyl-peptidase I [Treponemataceae bacterium]|nr:MAG: pyroglutamyl-peptidase I [Treponemataceae bacterium]